MLSFLPQHLECTIVIFQALHSPSDTNTDCALGSSLHSLKQLTCPASLPVEITTIQQPSIMGAPRLGSYPSDPSYPVTTPERSVYLRNCRTRNIGTKSSVKALRTLTMRPSECVMPRSCLRHAMQPHIRLSDVQWRIQGRWHLDLRRAECTKLGLGEIGIGALPVTSYSPLASDARQAPWQAS